MRLWPDYDGYLFVSDDMAVDPYHIMDEMDPDKMWTTSWSNMASIVNTTGEVLRWFLWYQERGLQSFVEAPPCLPRDTFERWERGYAMECKHCVVIHAADIGYTPWRFANDFRRWSYLLRETMNEIVFHNIVFTIANNESDVEILKGRYLWDEACLQVARFMENDKSTFVHPMKFSDISLRTFVETWLVTGQGNTERKVGPSADQRGCLLPSEMYCTCLTSPHNQTVAC